MRNQTNQNSNRRTNQNGTNQNRYESNASNLRSFRRYDLNRILKLANKFDQSTLQSKKEIDWWDKNFGMGKALRSEKAKNILNFLASALAQTGLTEIVENNEQLNRNSEITYKNLIRRVSRNSNEVFNPTSKNLLANGPLMKLIMDAVTEQQFLSQYSKNEHDRQKLRESANRFFKKQKSELRKIRQIEDKKQIEHSPSTGEMTAASYSVENNNLNQSGIKPLKEERPTSKWLASLQKVKKKTPGLSGATTQTKEQNIPNQQNNILNQLNNNNLNTNALRTITEESQRSKDGKENKDNKGNQDNKVNENKKDVDNNQAQTKTETQNVKNKNVKSVNGNGEATGKGSKKPNKQLGDQKKGRQGNTTIKKRRPENKTRENTPAYDPRSWLYFGGQTPNNLREIREAIIAKQQEKKKKAEQKNDEQNNQQQNKDNKSKSNYWLNQIERKKEEIEKKKEEIKRKKSTKGQQERLKKINTNGTNDVQTKISTEPITTEEYQKNADTGMQNLTDDKNIVESGENNKTNEVEQVKPQTTNNNDMIQHGSNNNDIQAPLDQGQPEQFSSEIDGDIDDETYNKFISILLYTILRDRMKTRNQIKPRYQMEIRDQMETIEREQERQNQPILRYRTCTRLPHKPPVPRATNAFKNSPKEVKEGLKKMLQRAKKWGNECKELYDARRMYGKQGEIDFYKKKLDMEQKGMRWTDLFKEKPITWKEIYGAYGTVPKDPYRSQQKINRW